MYVYALISRFFFLILLSIMLPTNDILTKTFEKENIKCMNIQFESQNFKDFIIIY